MLYLKGRHITVIALFIICISFIFQAAAYSVYFKNIGMGEGLSQISVMSIYQDELGRMWFGTREGVSIYDGERMTVFKAARNSKTVSEKDLLPGNECDWITGNSKGDIFFRCDGALMKYDIRKESFRTVKSGGLRTIRAVKGEIWCVFRDSIFTFDSNADSLCFKQKVNIPVISCFVALDSGMWLGTREGLFFQKWGGNPECIIEKSDIYSIFCSSKGEIWTGCRMDGLYRIAGETVIHYTEGRIASNQIRQFAEDDEGNIWFGTFKGLQKYNPDKDTFAVYRQQYLPGDISHVSVFSLHIDRQGTLWAGTYYGGVNYFNLNSDIFSHYICNPQREECLSYPFVGRMVEDKNGKIWICTEGGGLNCFDRKSRKFKVFANTEGGAGTGLKHNNLKSICYDRERHRLYIGTHTGGLYYYDIERNYFHNYLKDYRTGDRKPNDIIYQTEIYGNKLIVGARNGVFALNLETEKFEPFAEGGYNFSIDSEGYVWMSYFGGYIKKVNINDTSDFKDITLAKHNIRFQATKVVKIGGNIYVCTLGSGFYKYNEETDSFTEYTVDDGQILSNYCYDIAETRQGNIIITGDKGLTIMNPKDGTSTFVKLGINLPITSITEGCGILVCRDNEVFAGGTDGLVSFNEEDLPKIFTKYSLYFSELFIHNKRVYPDHPQGVLTQALPYTRELRLKHDRNNLLVNFSVDNYINLKPDNSYDYMLEGLDREWLSTSTPQVHYTNLSPGHYRLLVKDRTMNPSGTSPRRIELSITVLPPWYNTWWAWSFYLSAIFITVYMFLRARQTKHELVLSLEKERAEKDKNDQINEAKLYFFTNISHEFRTPLTLIISQIDLITQGYSNLQPFVYSKILKVRKNAVHMMDLISELLDFHRLEHGVTTLRLSEQNLVPYLQDIFVSFNDMAAKQSIFYSFSSQSENILLWYDPAQLQKVFFNLISNALKYTAEGGNIEVCIDENDKSVFIKVIDSGVGISSEDAERIFERFYQVGSKEQNSHNRHSTGIGLALSKNIVKLHKGDIRLSSSPGYGSIFTVEMPKGIERFAGDSNIVFVEKEDAASAQLNAEKQNITPEEYSDMNETLPPSKGKNRHLALIVEDNREISGMLHALFMPVYDVVLARDGGEGLEKAVSILPDLVVSDMMMPVMDGLELCRRLKSNINTCHIPFVILTAFNTDELKLEGLRQGADDYISKPFNSKILLVRCNNLVRNRLLMQNKTGNEPQTSDTTFYATNSQDKDLLERAVDCITVNISNSDFDVNFMAKELGVCRSSLYLKFKALTGMTPNDFIQDQRMHKAAAMLRNHPEKQITEISDNLGFCSLGYFSRCFKAKFGISPNDFRKRN